MVLVQPALQIVLLIFACPLGAILPTRAASAHCQTSPKLRTSAGPFGASQRPVLEAVACLGKAHTRRSITNATVGRIARLQTYCSLFRFQNCGRRGPLPSDPLNNRREFEISAERIGKVHLTRGPLPGAKRSAPGDRQGVDGASPSR